MFSISVDDLSSDSFGGLASQLAGNVILQTAAALLDHLVLSRGLDSVKAALDEFLVEDSSDRSKLIGIHDSIAVESAVNEFNLLQAAVFAQHKLQLAPWDDRNPLQSTLKGPTDLLASVYSSSGAFNPSDSCLGASLPQAVSPMQSSAPESARSVSSGTAGQQPFHQQRRAATARPFAPEPPGITSPAAAPTSVQAAVRVKGPSETSAGGGTKRLGDTWEQPPPHGTVALSVSAAKTASHLSAASTEHREQPRTGRPRPKVAPARRSATARQAQQRVREQAQQISHEDGDIAAAADLISRSAWMLR